MNTTLDFSKLNIGQLPAGPFAEFYRKFQALADEYFADVDVQGLTKYVLERRGTSYLHSSAFTDATGTRYTLEVKMSKDTFAEFLSELAKSEKDGIPFTPLS
jgi:hypothetical protein